ncbi:hypothetical protein [Aureibacillus halotolerans]|uniref:Putative small secreted protein n=1 Tax=Aureibacillus halotolerans TaxID=1508390 RepID=A0A4R6TYN9_9BACI|nr:hypothetical protein [Aureibacillus halotolerans]TDQ39068.1 putative small secreted protein [Aureibacillus halotolerans]
MSKKSISFIAGACLGAITVRVLVGTLFSLKITEAEALERAKRLVRDLGYEISGSWIVNQPSPTVIQGRTLSTLELGVMATDAYGAHHFHFQMDVYSGKLFVLTPYEAAQ